VTKKALEVSGTISFFLTGNSACLSPSIDDGYYIINQLIEIVMISIILCIVHAALLGNVIVVISIPLHM